jgi:hypothetical protein
MLVTEMEAIPNLASQINPYLPGCTHNMRRKGPEERGGLALAKSMQMLCVKRNETESVNYRKETSQSVKKKRPERQQMKLHKR